MVTKKIWILSVVFFLSFVVLGQNEELLLLQPSELKKDFQLLRTALEKTHAGLYAYTSEKEMNLVFEKMEKSLNQPMTSIDFFRKISELLKPIGNGHTKFLPPTDFMKAINSGQPRFPFAVYWHEDTLYVLRNISNEKEIQPGTIIKTINGEKASDVLQELVDNYTRDGHNNSFPRERILKDFSGYYAIYKGTPENFTMELIDSEGKENQLEIEALSTLKLNENYKERYSDSRGKSNQLPLRLEINNGIGVLTITTFDKHLIKKNGQNYKTFFKETFETIKNKQLKNLIIDVRDNGGGWPEVIVELHRYVSNKPYISQTVAHTITKKLPNQKYYKYGFWELLELRMLWKLKKKGDVFMVNRGKKTKTILPANNAFQGELYVLINPFSFSSTTSFLGMLKNDKRGIFIGETAGGSPHQVTAGMMPSLILPHSKIEAIVPLVCFKSTMKFEDTKDGVAPDHFVRNSIEDVIAGKDAVMEFALELIELN